MKKEHKADIFKTIIKNLSLVIVLKICFSLMACNKEENNITDPIEICEALARAGFYVFVPDHSDAVMLVRIQGQSNGTLDEALDHLNDNPFGNGENFGYRVSEMQSVIEFVNTSSFKIDKSKIILGGHSMGGWTVMKEKEIGFQPTAMFFFSMGELNWLYNQNRYFEASTFQSIDFATAYFYGGAEYEIFI